MHGPSRHQISDLKSVPTCFSSTNRCIIFSSGASSSSYSPNLLSINWFDLLRRLYSSRSVFLRCGGDQVHKINFLLAWLMQLKNSFNDTCITFRMALDRDTPGSPRSDLLFCPRTWCFFLFTRISKGLSFFSSSFCFFLANTAAAFALFPIRTTLWFSMIHPLHTLVPTCA